MGTPIDRVGGRGFEATRRGGTEGNLTMNKGRDWAEAVLGSIEGIEHNMDWKALLVRCAWSILRAALYYMSGLVSAGRPYGMIAI